MKTIKHLFVLCVLLFFAFTPVYANENENTYIYDDAELLTTEQHQTLHTEMDRISKTYQCSIHIVTIDDPTITLHSIQQFAEDIYEYNYDFGYGYDRDGYLLVLNAETRCYWLLAHGQFGNYSLTDYGKEWLSTQFLSDFEKDDWYHGLYQYVKSSEHVLKTAINDRPIDIYPDKKETDPTPMGLAISLLTGLFSAIFSCSHQKGKMQTAKIQTRAYAYIEQPQVEITQQYDHYMHTTTTRTKIETNSTSGKGTTVNHRGFSGKGGKF